MPDVQSAADRPVARPHPRRDPDSLPYWDAAQRHELLIQRCDQCGAHRFYARLLCPRCWSPDVTWERSSGRGTIYSFTIVHRAPSEAFRALVPYVVAVIDLEEGVRVMANILGTSPDDVRVGAPVRVVFEAIDDAVTLPQFELEG